MSFGQPPGPQGLAAGLTLLQLPIFSVRVPVQILNFVSNQMVCKVPLVILCYLLYMISSCIYITIHLFRFIYLLLYQVHLTYCTMGLLPDT